MRPPSAPEASPPAQPAEGTSRRAQPRRDAVLHRRVAGSASGPPREANRLVQHAVHVQQGDGARGATGRILGARPGRRDADDGAHPLARVTGEAVRQKPAVRYAEHEDARRVDAPPTSDVVEHRMEKAHIVRPARLGAAAGGARVPKLFPLPVPLSLGHDDQPAPAPDRALPEAIGVHQLLRRVRVGMEDEEHGARLPGGWVTLPAGFAPLRQNPVRATSGRLVNRYLVHLRRGATAEDRRARHRRGEEPGPKAP